MPNDSSDTSDDNNETVGNLERSSNSAEEQPDVTDGMPDEDGADTHVGSYAEPDGNTGADLNTVKVRDFFEKKGAVEILAQLADGSKRFSEIDEALVVSHGTIATRLTDGAKLGLWREFMTYPDDGGKIKLYELVPDAQHLAVIAEDENISQTTEQLRQANEQHADAIANFRDKIQTADSEP
ncbi:hypothetical protein [Halosolutus gelatinilyticus]|uniref:hypothetical protein n=1 Tax=Halosolutus gelatinilyticus TaxID=2931975 RepID=UPI001FF69BE1|nr:hypothetical protein [Halosolutus gelatinilyticus]